MLMTHFDNATPLHQHPVYIMTFTRISVTITKISGVSEVLVLWRWRSRVLWVDDWWLHPTKYPQAIVFWIDVRIFLFEKYHSGCQNLDWNVSAKSMTKPSLVPVQWPVITQKTVSGVRPCWVPCVPFFDAACSFMRLLGLNSFWNGQPLYLAKPRSKQNHKLAFSPEGIR